MGSYVISTTVALAVVCALAVVLLRLFARRPTGSSRLKILERLPLEPRRSLYLVEAGGRVLLVGVGDGAMATLAELDAAAIASAPANASTVGCASTAGTASTVEAASAPEGASAAGVATEVASAAGIASAAAVPAASGRLPISEAFLRALARTVRGARSGHEAG